MRAAGSMIMTVGTALSRAADAGATVSVLIGGEWITGEVVGSDSHGVLLRDRSGDQIVVVVEAVHAVRIHAHDPHVPSARVPAVEAAR